MNEYDIGDSVRTSTEFKVASVLTDPTVITLKVKTPTGTISTYIYNSGDGVIIRDSAGVYRADIVVTAAGTWTYKWIGTGAAAAVEERQFRARTPAIP